MLTISRPSWTTHSSNDVVLKEYWDLQERLPWQNKTSSPLWFPVDGFTNGNTIITVEENAQEHGWLWFATYGPLLWNIFCLPLLRLNSVPLQPPSPSIRNGVHDTVRDNKMPLLFPIWVCLKIGSFKKHPGYPIMVFPVENCHFGA